MKVHRASVLANSIQVICWSSLAHKHVYDFRIELFRITRLTNCMNGPKRGLIGPKYGKRFWRLLAFLCFQCIQCMSMAVMAELPAHYEYRWKKAYVTVMSDWDFAHNDVQCVSVSYPNWRDICSCILHQPGWSTNQPGVCIQAVHFHYHTDSGSSPKNWWCCKISDMLRQRNAKSKWWSQNIFEKP